VTQAESAGATEAHTRKRLEDMLDFVETITNWYGQLRRLPSAAMVKFLKAGGSAKKLLAIAR